MEEARIRETPIERKFGYQWLMEISELEREVALELGLDPGVFHPDIFFGARRRYDEKHKGDPTFRQRQEAARARGEKWVPQPIKSQPSEIDKLRKALEAIRDGHNDPRALARSVLGADNDT